MRTATKNGRCWWKIILERLKKNHGGWGGSNRFLYVRGLKLTQVEEILPILPISAPQRKSFSNSERKLWLQTY